MVKRGKPLARTAMAAGRKAIPARSAKRTADAPARREVVAQVLARDAHACRAPAQLLAAGIEDDETLPARCGGPLDVHERITRASWPAGYLRVDNCLTLCRAHHDWAHDHPQLAYAAVLLAHSSSPRPPTKENPDD